MNIKESAENCLEMIMMLREKKGYVRSVDIATELAVTKPSVSHAMKQLRENGYITMDKENFILLTVAGETIARKIYKRHHMLIQFLSLLGVSEEIAEQDACKMEHGLSEESVDAIYWHVQQMLAEAEENKGE